MFKPGKDDATADDDTYLLHIIIKQLAFFGPVKRPYLDLIPKEDTDRWSVLAYAN